MGTQPRAKIEIANITSLLHQLHDYVIKANRLYLAEKVDAFCPTQILALRSKVTHCSTLRELMRREVVRKRKLFLCISFQRKPGPERWNSTPSPGPRPSSRNAPRSPLAGSDAVLQTTHQCTPTQHRHSTRRLSMGQQRTA